IGDEQLARLEQLVSTLSEVGAQLVATAQDLAAAFAGVTTPPTVEPAPARTVPPPARIPPPAVVTPPNGNANAVAPQLRAGERRMLDVLARHYPLKVTRTQLGTLAGYTARGGTFGAYFGTLKRHGLIEEVNGDIQITRAGLDQLGLDVPAQPHTTEELLAI